MFLLLPLVAVASDAILHVGVPTAVGTPGDLTVAGASGPCTTDEAHVVCPATSPVTFSWSGPDHTLVGDVSVAPGSVGRAWVLARPSRTRDAVAELETLTGGEIDRTTLLGVRRLLVYTSDWTPPLPSAELLDAHLALARHPDPKIRREAVEGLFPWVAGTPFDPFPVTAPIPVPEALLRDLAVDPDKGVRRRLAHQLRTPRPDLSRDLARELLRILLDDPHPGVRRAAVVALPEAVDREVFDAEDAWMRLLSFVPRPRPDGRAACNQLARMRPRLDRAGVTVDPVPAMEAVLAHHPERAWKLWLAWKDDLPLEPRWIRRLLHDTTGLDLVLIRHWAVADRELLDAIVEDWQPSSFAERKTFVTEALRRLDARAADAPATEAGAPPDPQ